MLLLQFQIANLLSSKLRSKKATSMLPLFPIYRKDAFAQPTNKPSSVLRNNLQRREGSKSNRAQLEIFESSSQNCLDILWIASEEEPAPHNMRLKREDVSRLLLGHYVNSFLDMVQQLSSVVGLDELDDIYDSRRIWAGIRRSRFASEFLGCSRTPVFAPGICE